MRDPPPTDIAQVSHRFGLGRIVQLDLNTTVSRFQRIPSDEVRARLGLANVPVGHRLRASAQWLLNPTHPVTPLS